MRHGIKGKKLSRTSAHKKRTMQALSMALIKEHRIVTTLAKAKELRRYVEPLITRAKEDTHHNRKQVFSSLQNNEAVNLLFSEVGPKSKDRPGGYTRVIKAGFRKGDGAELAVVELVDYNDIKPEGSSNKSSKKRTRRAGKSNTPTSSAKSANEPDKESNSDIADEKSEDAKDLKPSEAIAKQDSAQEEE